MTLPRWPSELPRPMRQGYARTLPDGRDSTKPEAGPPRVRRAYSAAISPVSLTIDVSADQRLRFRRFWTEDTRHGSLPWMVIDWTTDGLALATAGGDGLTTATGAPLILSAWHLVMFGSDAPGESLVGIRYRIAFQISIMP